ncbi:ankyrin repeat-containing domain protein [Talaromyces proteolyticus]|uniref:Ankyrin repeat-containing domain protein n=1 Tax=Talaromyces proteolyticus TaxID=1131652 RepID=A0AAD4KMB7_9EURO|nr:ankyrin repeat-containing domain protein [Talaromyces proteolyticus]KAH8694266.1 ankyrin repeat-containing domain protein [Talaromyces proteolyticus]
MEDVQIYDRPHHLMRAALKQNSPVFERILSKTKVKSLNILNMNPDPKENGEHINLVTALIIGILSCDAYYVRRILEHGGNPNLLGIKNSRDSMPPIKWAAIRGDTSILQALIDFGADVNDCRPEVSTDEDAWTPLHIAVSQRRMGAVRLLIRAGANPKHMMGDNFSILMQARSWVGGLRVLLNVCKFDQDVLDDALREAIVSLDDFTAPAKCLIEAGAIPTYDLFCRACGKEPGAPLLGIRLLVRCGFRANMTGSDGLTVLHVTTRASVASVLVKEMPGIANALDSIKRKTPLEWMYTNSYPDFREQGRLDEVDRHAQSELTATLVKNGAELFIARDSWDRNILFFAVEYGHISAVREVLNQKPELLHSRDSLGNTPLHMAASSYSEGTLDCLELLLERNNDVNARNHLGQAALHCISSQIPSYGNAPREYLDIGLPVQKARVLLHYNHNIMLCGRRDDMTKPTTAMVEAISRGKPKKMDKIMALRTEKYLEEGLFASVKYGFFEIFDQLLNCGTNLSICTITETGDTLYHALALGVSTMGATGYAVTVGYRLLGYNMSPDWDENFHGTNYTDDGRPIRNYLHIAEMLSRDECREEFVFKKNNAGHSAFDLLGLMTPAVDWEYLFKNCHYLREKEVNPWMPDEVFIPTVNLDDLFFE